MMNMKVSADTTLLEALMQSGGFPTNTRARKAIKGGFVSVNGAVNRIPSTAVEAGTEIVWNPEQPSDNTKKPASSFKDFNLGGASKTPLNKPAPFEVIYEDDALLAYIKPAGWVFASPNPKVKTSYTRMKEWMEEARPDCTDVHFVNRIEKESSGICFIAKDLQWRVHLQKHWANFARGLYVLVEGHLPPDDEVFAFKAEEGKKKKERVAFPYRTMRATASHTLLKFQVGFDQIPELMSGLRRAQCLIIGKGESAPNPLSRSGLHLYHVVVEGPEGQVVEAKTRVPREFLNLMKGGKGPRARSAEELKSSRERKPAESESRPAHKTRSKEDASSKPRPARKGSPSDKAPRPARKGGPSDKAPRRIG